MTILYKICSRAEWQDALFKGQYDGSAQDRQDGFIHLSTALQWPQTARRYYQGAQDMVLIALDGAMLEPHLHYEPAPSGELFPHFYASLPVQAALWVRDMILDSDQHLVIAESPL